MRNYRQRLEGAVAGLRLLGPEHVLARGYSITTDERGRLVKDLAELQCGQNIQTRLRAGEILSKIQEIKQASRSS
jgi:exodeoxyribonuclease VII large subunit